MRFLKKTQNLKLYNNIQEKTCFYFIHSYYASIQDKSVKSCETVHENFSFCSSIEHENLFATQFHPERQMYGISLIQKLL